MIEPLLQPVVTNHQSTSSEFSRVYSPLTDITRPRHKQADRRLSVRFDGKNENSIELELASGSRNALFFFFLTDCVGLDIAVCRPDKLGGDCLLSRGGRLEGRTLDTFGDEF